MEVFNVSGNAKYELDEDGDYDYDRPIPGTGFTGQLCTRAERFRNLLTFLLFAGFLPEELGNLINLKLFTVEDNDFQGAQHPC